MTNIIMAFLFPVILAGMAILFYLIMEGKFKRKDKKR